MKVKDKKKIFAQAALISDVCCHARLNEECDAVAFLLGVIESSAGVIRDTVNAIAKVEKEEL